MSDNTKIEWCDASWNPMVGCGGCELGGHCYAARMAWRLANNPKIDERDRTAYREVVGGCSGEWNGFVAYRPWILGQPAKWKKPRRIFVCSMGDPFADLGVGFLERIWRVMRDCPQHTFLVLTKQAKKMREYVSGLAEMFGVLRNVHLYVSATSQRTLDARLPHLLDTPAAMRGVSLEPLLGPVDVGELRDIDHVIVGGETGPGARPMHPDWARAIRDACVEAGIPFFFKSWGDWAPFREYMLRDPQNDIFISPDGTVRPAWGERGNLTTMRMLGKRKAGRELDGRTWEELPT